MLKQQGGKIFNGLVWKTFEQFGTYGVQFVLQIILARILSPEHYGILAIMVIFTGLAAVFVQNGFNTALIQNKDTTEEDYSSVLWMSMGVALLLYIIFFFSVPSIIRFYGMADVTAEFRVLALMLFPGALNSVQIAKASKNMEFRKIFVSKVGAIIVSGITSVIIALMGGGLWALVVQQILTALIACIVMRFTVKLKIVFTINFKRIKILFGFGWKVLVSSLVDTLYQDLRSLIIGGKYDGSTLGYYNRGKHFPQTITNVVGGSVKSVMLPAMSAIQSDRSRVKELMRKAMSIGTFLVFPMMAGLAAVGDNLVSILLTDKWLPCVPYMQIYCFTLAFYPIHSCNLQAINALGRSDIYLKLEIIKKFIGVVSLIFVVLMFDSPVAIALTGAFTAIISMFINAFPNRKLLNYGFLEQIKDVLPSMVLSLVMCGIVLILGRLNINVYLLIILQVIMGALVYIVLSKLFKLECFDYVLGTIKGFIKKKK